MRTALGFKKPPAFLRRDAAGTRSRQAAPFKFPIASLIGGDLTSSGTAGGAQCATDFRT
jgi:hypothetical protein